MEQGLKERLVGAAVLVIIAVIFIPMLLDESPDSKFVITETNIPPKPDTLPSTKATDFSSRIIPLENEKEPETPAISVETSPEEPEQVVESAVVKPPETEREPITQQARGDKTKTTVGLSAWVVQLGSFNSEENAEAMNKKLRKAGYAAFVEPIKQNNKTVYRVRVGPELKRSDAENILKKLKSGLKLEGIVVSYP